MTSSRRPFAGAILALALATAANAQDTTGETVVATVNGTDIKVGHMIVLRARLPEQYRTLDDQILFDGILEQLIQQTALSQSLDEPLSLSDRLSLENDRRSYLAGVALQATVEAAVSDDAVQSLYDTQFADAEPGTEYNAAHILVPTREQAEEIRAEIEAGADFGEQAREHSTDGAAQGDGALGWFGAGMMVPAFEAAVMALEAGEVSEPVQTQFGWHLVRLNETREVTPPSLEDIRAELENAIRQGAVEDRINDLVAAAEIRRNVEGIDRSVLSDQTLLDE